MSTFSLSKPCHVSIGNNDYDFEEGTVEAATLGEEKALERLVANKIATLVTYSAIEPPDEAEDPEPDGLTGEPPAVPDPPAPVGGDDVSGLGEGAGNEGAGTTGGEATA